MNEETSLKILKEIFGAEDEFLGIEWNNHRASPSLENCYQVTTRILSIDSLVKLLEHPDVKNAYFQPRYAPPDTSKRFASVTLQYRLYVQYN